MGVVLAVHLVVFLFPRVRAQRTGTTLSGRVWVRAVRDSVTKSDDLIEPRRINEWSPAEKQYACCGATTGGLFWKSEGRDIKSCPARHTVRVDDRTRHVLWTFGTTTHNTRRVRSSSGVRRGSTCKVKSETGRTKPGAFGLCWPPCAAMHGTRVRRAAPTWHACPCTAARRACQDAHARGLRLSAPGPYQDTVFRGNLLMVAGGCLSYRSLDNAMCGP